MLRHKEDNVPIEQIPHEALHPLLVNLEREMQAEMFRGDDPELATLKRLRPRFARVKRFGKSLINLVQVILLVVTAPVRLPVRATIATGRFVGRNWKALVVILALAAVVGVQRFQPQDDKSTTKPVAGRTVQPGNAVKTTTAKAEAPAPVVSPAATAVNQPAPSVSPAPQPQPRPAPSRGAAPPSRPIVTASPVPAVPVGGPPAAAAPVTSNPVPPVNPPPPVPTGGDQTGTEPGTVSDPPPDQASGDCPAGQHKVPPLWNCA